MERAIRVVERLKGPVVPVNICFGDDDSLDMRAMWLPSIKSALHLHGLYPNHRLRIPAVSHGDEQHQEVRTVLEHIFGNIKPAKL